MHRLLYMLSSSVALAAATVALQPAPAAAQTVLRFDNWLPAGHSMMAGCITPWIEQVEKATEGRVRVELTGASLGTPQRQYDMVVQSIVDVAIGLPGYTPGRFDMTEVAELPFKGDSAEVRSVGLWRVTEAMLGEAGEFRDTQPLALFTTGTGVIMMGNRPVRSLEEYQGLKLRIGGGIVSEINQTLGGVNVAAPASEIYEMISQGIVDGTLVAPEGYNSFGFKNVVKYVTEFPGGFYASGWYVVMNKSKFDGLSEQDREALMSVSGEHMSRMCGKAIDAADQAGREAMKADGVEIIVASDEFTTAVREKLGPIEDAWIAKATAKGMDGVAAIRMFEEVVEEVNAGK